LSGSVLDLGAVSPRFLPNIINHILAWRWEDAIHRKVAVATTQRGLGTRCAGGLLAMISDAKERRVVECTGCLYPSGSSMVIEDWGNITGVRACGPPSALGYSWQQESSLVSQLGSGRPVTGASTIDNMVILTIDVTFRSINSSSPG